MKQTYKVYQLAHTFVNYRAVVNVEGKQETIKFSGGTTSPKVTGGIYATTDEKIQKAIENRKDFNDLIVLSYSSEQEEQLKKIVVTPESVEKLVVVEPVIPTKAEGHVINDVTNFQAARSWIATNIEGMTFAMMPNKVAVAKVMSENKIEFPDWTV